MHRHRSGVQRKATLVMLALWPNLPHGPRLLGDVLGWHSPLCPEKGGFSASEPLSAPPHTGGGGWSWGAGGLGGADRTIRVLGQDGKSHICGPSPDSHSGARGTEIPKLVSTCWLPPLCSEGESGSETSLARGALRGHRGGHGGQCAASWGSWDPRAESRQYQVPGHQEPVTLLNVMATGGPACVSACLKVPDAPAGVGGDHTPVSWWPGLVVDPLTTGTGPEGERP